MQLRTVHRLHAGTTSEHMAPASEQGNIGIDRRAMARLIHLASALAHLAHGQRLILACFNVDLSASWREIGTYRLEHDIPVLSPATGTDSSAR